ncbi:RNA polymerase sigma factor [Nonomuraea wenchangensis]|uniref:RNA polymerase sigma factor n=1 Tax=Nonomuraea wenchangensis TaxID=568860 RepID=UPI00384A4634
MSQPLTDQRPRAELIAELYDRHAAGLFAYCADQLGDLGSASDVLLAVLNAVPAAEPPRAALYAFARREIHRRDVVYAPPAVDPLIDPATALVERTLRELRLHQREVLVLCAVCGLSKAELAWVLDVAPDTAEELAVGAGHRFRQALGTALASIGARVPKPVADIYGALGVAPLRDVLGRLPWPQPPGALRIHFAGSRTAQPAPLFVKPRWPSPPVWPQPLADADPATSTVIFPAELLSPPPASRVSEHEATTAPMPKLRAPLGPPPGLTRPLRDPLGAFDAQRAKRTPVPPVPPPPPGGERPFFMAAPAEDGLRPFATGDVLLPKDSPEPYATGDVLLPGEPTPFPQSFSPPFTPPFTPPFPSPAPSGGRGGLRRPEPVRRSQPTPADDVLVHKGPPRPVQPGGPQQEEDGLARETAPLFQPRAKPAEPVYRLPWEDEPAGKDAPARKDALDPRPVRARPVPKRRPELKPRPEKKRRRKERHYDWVWELVGFLVCVAIAMIVFFSVPNMFNP